MAGPGGGTRRAGDSGLAGRGWAPIDPPGHSASSPISAGPGSLGTGGGRSPQASQPEQGRGQGAARRPGSAPVLTELESRGVEDHLAGGRWCLTLHTPLRHRLTGR